jgi:hypothetical protein
MTRRSPRYKEPPFASKGIINTATSGSRFAPIPISSAVIGSPALELATTMFPRRSRMSWATMREQSHKGSVEWGREPSEQNEPKRLRRSTRSSSGGSRLSWAFDLQGRGEGEDSHDLRSDRDVVAGGPFLGALRRGAADLRGWWESGDRRWVLGEALRLYYSLTRLGFGRFGESRVSTLNPIPQDQTLNSSP